MESRTAYIYPTYTHMCLLIYVVHLYGYAYISTSYIHIYKSRTTYIYPTRDMLLHIYVGHLYGCVYMSTPYIYIRLTNYIYISSIYTYVVTLLCRAFMWVCIYVCVCICVCARACIRARADVTFYLKNMFDLIRFFHHVVMGQRQKITNNHMIKT